MKQSLLFTKTQRESPSDEVSLNAELLIKAGYVYKEMSGVYSFLPLGLRVLKKIEGIIREEMNRIGGTEMKTSIFQSKDVWDKTGRWDDSVVDIWFKTKLKNGGDLGLSFTNEEAYANILKQHINSYKDLPAYPYDFKEIFRNEARSKSGILRGREFFWKALYSFSKDEEEHNIFYEKAKEAYKNIFKRVGIGHLTYLTFASGGTFSKYSHEFQTLTGAGEDTIYLDENRGLAINKEIYDEEELKFLGLKKEDLIEKKSIEVGNIFSLGTKFTEPFNLIYKDKDGREKLVIMGSYGIGLGRLMGTVVEVLSDDKGIIWPESIAPFKIHLLSLGKDEKVLQEAENLYKELTQKGIEVLYDDREDVSAGEKFADSDLMGIPFRVIISNRTVTEGGYELKKRTEEKERIVKREELFKL
ncbi:MAG TPA: His/Gly/Thr/Pro-type tRNA ligase C-terminal domain-containing protein [Candidatus Paceibacterota bacterium]|nr:His/Gly/Thr/Pro-type tRNA ligase C-terminal domain-containing protein [Candidatus Paceibacterota bacterium]HPC12483.1 His/Gly/Thr/Pro-type tRNA ligase C-terminal domain-containing protein [Candidatus Paceibacterota bacterium]HQM18508.1 His/Gly/Thr/Pro-type tRNA ligase C-terminal domain-containing protein [Candidatus Paceibacterota bacterium]HQQ21939.1 His/Gly/Thr/Pro-type tRNA ligase C-terminal domain-containing protein [Candidatus Paceibacterota bacterium]